MENAFLLPRIHLICLYGLKLQQTAVKIIMKSGTHTGPCLESGTLSGIWVPDWDVSQMTTKEWMGGVN